MVNQSAAYRHASDYNYHQTSPLPNPSAGSEKVHDSVPGDRLSERGRICQHVMRRTAKTEATAADGARKCREKDSVLSSEMRMYLESTELGH